MKPIFLKPKINNNPVIELFIPITFLKSYHNLFIQYNLQSELKNIQCYFLLLNTIRYKSIYKQYSKQKNDYIRYIQFANLHSNYLINLLGKHYKKYIDNLLKMDVIECDFVHKINKKCYGYKLTNKYIQTGDAGEFEKITIDKKNKIGINIINRLNKISKDKNKIFIKKKKQQTIIQKKPQNINLTKNIKLFFKDFKYKEAAAWVNINLSKNKQKTAISYLDKFRNGDIDFKIGKYGRYYNIITNCKKELLRFHNSDNFSSELIEVDQTGAQPTLLNLLYLKYKITNTNKIVSGVKYNWEMDCINIYEILTKIYNEYYNKKYSRDRIKKRLITFLNQKIYYNKKNDLYPIIKKYYPSLIKLLFKIKEKNHKNFAREYQTLESDIFIKQILIPFSEKYFILSKHDAFIIKLEDYTYLQQLIYKTFINNKIYNYKFKIKLLRTDKQINSDDISNLLFNSIIKKKKEIIQWIYKQC